MKRKVLGKGIEAIISNKPNITGKSGFVELEIDNIYPNPFQPRKDFPEDKIVELAKSIEENGLIQPIVVYSENRKYYLLVGERRWRSAQRLKWKKIPAIIKDVNSREVMIGALVENIQRENLNAIEIADAIRQMMGSHSLTQEEIGEKLSMSRASVANYLRLLKLPAEIKKSIIDRVITQGHARALLGLEDEDRMLKCFRFVVKKNLSVRKTEEMVTAEKTISSDNNRKTENISVPDPDIEKAEQNLSRLFSTKVKLQYKNGKGGKITIFFNNPEEYERIYTLFVKE